MARKRPPRMAYQSDNDAGRDAAIGGLQIASCPHGTAEIGRRCAWLAGYRDAKGESK